uniref:Uncharacterized protein n=1 Tax=Oryza sativa subsp. japonica TaxID=39947 RepID=Q6Z5E8_ORYSJ|nr:hypothetical protein [Oryza sativa Japonica Group]
MHLSLSYAVQRARSHRGLWRPSFPLPHQAECALQPVCLIGVSRGTEPSIPMKSTLQLSQHSNRLLAFNCRPPYELRELHKTSTSDATRPPLRLFALCAKINGEEKSDFINIQPSRFQFANDLT